MVVNRTYWATRKKNAHQTAKCNNKKVLFFGADIALALWPRKSTAIKMHLATGFAPVNYHRAVGCYMYILRGTVMSNGVVRTL